MTVRGTQYMLLQSGKGREGETDSDGRDYSSKEEALSFEVWLHFVQLYKKHFHNCRKMPLVAHIQNLTHWSF